MRNWQKRRAQGAANGGKMLVTTKMFLGKEGNLQFITADELFHFNDHSREDDVNEMVAFFDLVKAGYKPIITRKTRKDQGGNPYKYQSFNRNGNPDGVKVLLIGNIFDFIEGLYDSKYVINFTYDELIEEAEQV